MSSKKPIADIETDVEAMAILNRMIKALNELPDNINMDIADAEMFNEYFTTHSRQAYRIGESIKKRSMQAKYQTYITQSKIKKCG